MISQGFERSFPSIRLLNGRVDSVTLSEVLQFVEQEIEGGRFLQIITVNSLMLLETEDDDELAELFSSAGLVIADSIGVMFMSWIKGLKLKARIPGIDLIIALCGKAAEKNWPVYLIGSAPGVSEKSMKALKEKYPLLKFCGVADGYFTDQEEERILREIKQHRPKFIFVGMGSPKQEKWIHSKLHGFTELCAMGVGGSFDVISGQLMRAPVWLRKIGMEWFFRFLQEPWRWKRILKLPLLFYKVFRR